MSQYQVQIGTKWDQYVVFETGDIDAALRAARDECESDCPPDWVKVWFGGRAISIAEHRRVCLADLAWLFSVPHTQI